MTTLLLKLDQPVNDVRDIADPERLLGIVRQLQQEEVTVETLANGITHAVTIEGSSVNYTLSLNPDGTGMIQRTMSSPGSQHMTVNPGNREAVLTSIPQKEGGGKPEIHILSNEPFALPVVVGTPDGFRLRGIFLYGPE